MQKGRQAQLQISFSMIFSIILIIAFLAVAIYAIFIFLGIKKCADTGLFKNDLQDEIDRAWSSDETSLTFSGNLPGSLEQACFIDLSLKQKGTYKEQYDKFKKYGYQGNMFFYPLKNACEGQKAFELKHLDITKITQQDNPYCVKNVNGKLEAKIEKGFYDALVGISKIYENGKPKENDELEFCGSSTLASCSSNSDCKEGGCSGQVCEGKNENTITTCEYKDCYDNEKYSLACKCVNGKCRWD